MQGQHRLWSDKESLQIIMSHGWTGHPLPAGISSRRFDQTFLKFQANLPKVSSKSSEGFEQTFGRFEDFPGRSYKFIAGGEVMATVTSHHDVEQGDSPKD